MDRVYDRIPEFDERSRNFPIRSLRRGPGRAYTWACAKHLDQGNQGACVGFGVAHELIARPVPVMRIDGKYARSIYQEAKRVDSWPGENYSGTSVLAGCKVAQARGWIEGYYWAFGINDLIAGLAGGPAVLGVNWYSGMERPDKAGFIKVSGQSRGGHCILCKGLSNKGKFFILHNSWGKGWGRGGDCKIRFSDMERLLSEKGEAAFFVGRKRTGR
jgi:hypothetical protein